VRPVRTFEEAAIKFVQTNQQKRSLASDVYQLQMLMPWIGNVPLDKIHSGTLQSWIDDRVAQGKATNTINHGLKIVRRVLNLAATEWVDDKQGRSPARRSTAVVPAVEVEG
jgi:hypothetical protein